MLITCEYLKDFGAALVLGFRWAGRTDQLSKSCFFALDLEVDVFARGAAGPSRDIERAGTWLFVTFQANGKLDIERFAGLEPDRLFIPSPGGEPKTSEAGSESMGSGRHFGCFVLAIAKVAEKPTVDRRANSR